MIISGFDVFILGIFGMVNIGLCNGNFLGVIVFVLDGCEFRLVDGSLLCIEVYLLLVSYDLFNCGMQEDILGFWFCFGLCWVDVFIIISQGGVNQFWLEVWNGCFYGFFVGNDGIVYCFVDSVLFNYVFFLGSVINFGIVLIFLWGFGCNINLLCCWFGYDSVSCWWQNLLVQFFKVLLLVCQLFVVDIWCGIEWLLGVISQVVEGFDVIWYINYDFFFDCVNLCIENVLINGVMNVMFDFFLVFLLN